MSNCRGCDEKPGSIKIQSSNLMKKMFQDVTGLEGKKIYYKNIFNNKFAFLVESTWCLCKSCQLDLKTCYNFRKQCIEIYSLHEDALNPLEKVFVGSINEIFKQSPQHKGDESFEALVFPSDGEHDVEKESFSNPDNEQSKDCSASRYDEPVSCVEEGRIKANRFQCTDCPKSYSKNSAFLNHQLSHQDKRDFICNRPHCKSAFNVISRLNRHLRTVHDASEEEIDSYRQTKRKHSLDKSRKSRSGTEKTQMQCEICLKVLSNFQNLEEHMMLIHLNNAPYRCENKACGKRFAHFRLLKQHQKKHDGIFDFKCEYCSKEFVQKKVLNQHLKKSHQITQKEIEAKDRANSSCEECKKTFKSYQQFTEHNTLEHGKGDMFICDICAKSIFNIN